MKFGLIGKPLQHSYSQKYFRENLLSENDSYELIELSEDQLADFILNTDFNGLNVTIPYKIEILLYVEHISDEVAAIGSTNCLKKTELGWLALNTDIIGFEKTLQNYEGIEDMQAIILGTGGSSRAVAYVFKQKGIPYKCVSRNPNADQISYTEVDANLLHTHRLIVNCTPLGMSPQIDSYPDIEYDALTSDHICIDLIYNPEKTIFLAEAEKRNAHIQNGLQMLYWQADASYLQWTSTDQ